MALTLSVRPCYNLAGLVGGDRMSFRAAAIGVVLGLLTAPPAWADDAKIYPAEAAIPNSRVIRFTSAIDKEPYTIQIAMPWAAAPKGGYPVIYILDGDLLFPEAAMESAYNLAEKAAVVVSVGHGTLNDRAVTARYAGGKPGRDINGDAATDAFFHLRQHDFEWPAKPEHRAPFFVEKIFGAGFENGDLDAFLQVIEKEIKPKVEAVAPIDRNNQAIFGWSLGGLAVTRALFTEPTAYHSYIIVSPSLWYDGGGVLNDERRFADGVTKGAYAPRVLIVVGSREPMTNDFPKSFLDLFTPEQRVAIVPYQKMLLSWPAPVPGARDLAARLKALHGKPGYTVEYLLAEGQDHGGAPHIAINRGLTFAFLEK
jgi:uncharacterized protein